MLAIGERVDEQCALGAPTAAAAGGWDSDKVACHAIRAVGHLLSLVTPRLLPPVSDRGSAVVLSALQVHIPMLCAVHACGCARRLACCLI